MRYALLALLLPAVASAGGGNEAEKLFRGLEKKVRDAKALRVVADVKGEGKRWTMTFHVELTVAQGNKVRFKTKGEAKQGGKAKQTTAELISDGKKLWATDERGKVREEEAPKQLGQAFRTALSRFAALYGFQTAGDVRGPARDLEKLVAVRDFLSGGTPKVKGRATRVVQYTVAHGGPKDTARVTLYLDAKTLLPLQRVISVEGEGRIVETYTEFTLNPKLDPRTFELPK